MDPDGGARMGMRDCLNRSAALRHCVANLKLAWRMLAGSSQPSPAFVLLVIVDSAYEP